MKKGKKNNLKKLLCIVLTMAMALTMLPLGRDSVSAFTPPDKMLFTYFVNDYAQVEEGKCFYYGDFIHVNDPIYNYSKIASRVNGVVYSTSNESVASVDAQTGYVETKKKGTAEITCTYKGETKTCQFAVKPAGSLTEDLTAKQKKKIKKIERQLVPAVVSAVEEGSITVSNGYDILEAYLNYKSAVVYKKSVLLSDGSLRSNENRYVVPLAARVNVLGDMIVEYRNQYLPSLDSSFDQTGTGSTGITIPIVSISASAKKITIKAEEKMTAEQILALQTYTERPIGRDKVDGKVFKVVDVKTREKYQANGVFTEGSRQIQCSISNLDAPSKPARLKKGHTYRLGDENNWPWGIKVKVK